MIGNMWPVMLMDNRNKICYTSCNGAAETMRVVTKKQERPIIKDTKVLMKRSIVLEFL